MEYINKLINNLYEILITQTNFNGKICKEDVEFQNCVLENFLSEELREINIFENFHFIINHDVYLINNEMCEFINSMNFFPCICLLLSNPFCQKIPIFPEIILNLFKVLSHILNSKGGICLICKNSDNLRILMKILNFLQKNFNNSDLLFQNPQIYNFAS